MDTERAAISKRARWRRCRFCPANRGCNCNHHRPRPDRYKSVRKGKATKD